jgi:hypothetical protein
MSQSLTRLATARLLGAGPETCKRVETQVLLAIKKAEWNQARQLLRMRLQMRLAPDAKDRATIERLLNLIDEAEARGIQPDP